MTYDDLLFKGWHILIKMAKDSPKQLLSRNNDLHDDDGDDSDYDDDDDDDDYTGM